MDVNRNLRYTVISKVFKLTPNFKILEARECHRETAFLQNIVWPYSDTKIIKNVNKLLQISEDYISIMKKIELPDNYSVSDIKKFSELPKTDLEYELISILTMLLYVRYIIDFEEQHSLEKIFDLYSLTCSIGNYPYHEIIALAQTDMSIILLDTKRLEAFPHFANYIFSSQYITQILFQYTIKFFIYIVSEEGLSEESYALKLSSVVIKIILSHKEYFTNDLARQCFAVLSQHLISLNEVALSIVKYILQFMTENESESIIAFIAQNVFNKVENWPRLIKTTQNDYLKITTTPANSRTFSFTESNIDVESNIVFPSIEETILMPTTRHLLLAVSKLVKFNKKSRYFVNIYGSRLNSFTGESFYDHVAFYISMCIMVDESQFFFENVFSASYSVFHQTPDTAAMLATVRSICLKQVIEKQADILPDLYRLWITSPIIFAEVNEILIKHIKLIESNMHIRKLTRAIQEAGIVIQQASEQYGSHPDFRAARVSHFRLIRALFAADDPSLLLKDRLFFSYVLSLLFEKSLRIEVLSLLTKLVDDQMVIAELEQIVGQVSRMPFSQNVCSFMSDLLRALVFTSHAEKHAQICYHIDQMMQSFAATEGAAEFFHRAVDFYIRAGIKPEYVSTLEQPLQKIENPGIEFIHSLLSLLFGFRTNTIDPRFPIVTAHAMNVLYDVYKDSDIFDILKFSESLCNFSVSNIFMLHEAKFDLVILEDIEQRKDSENSIDRIPSIFNVFRKIASTVSSPVVVQKMINLLTPNDLKHISRAHSMLLNPLIGIFSNERLSPPSFIPLSQVNNISLQGSPEFDFSTGIAFTCWAMVPAADPAILCRIQNDPTLIAKIIISSDMVSVNGVQFPHVFATKAWMFIAVTFDSNGVLTLTVNETKVIKDFKVDVPFDVAKLSIVVGGTPTSTIKAGNVIVNPLASYKKSVSDVFKLGPKRWPKSYFSDGQKPRSDLTKNFSTVFFEVFGVQVLLPLFAHIDLKTKDGQSPHLISDIFHVLSEALLVSVEGQKRFFQENGFKIVSHLIYISDRSNITFELYVMFFDLFDRLAFEDLKKQLFYYVLARFDIWSLGTEETQTQIYQHIIFVSFPTNAVYFQEFMNVQHVIYALHTYYAHTATLRNISPQKAAKDVRPIRKQLIKIAALCMDKFLEQKDIDLLCDVIAVSGSEAKKELCSLLLYILESGKTNGMNIFNRFQKVHFTLTNDGPETLFVIIRIIIKIHQISQCEITVHQHIDLLVRQLSSRSLPIDFLSDIANLIGTNNCPQLFPLFSFLVMRAENPALIGLIPPSQSYVCTLNWCVYSVIAAVSAENFSSVIYTFLIRCDPNEIRNIADTIENVCITNQKDSIPHMSAFLLCCIDAIHDETIENGLIQIFFNILTDHLFFCRHNYINTYFEKQFIGSPFDYEKEAEPILFTKMNPTWSKLAGYFPECDMFYDSSVNPRTFECFGLEMDENGKWLHLELAEKCLELISTVGTGKEIGIVIAVCTSLSGSEAGIEFIKRIQLTEAEKIEYEDIINLVLIKYSITVMGRIIVSDPATIVHTDHAASLATQIIPKPVRTNVEVHKKMQTIARESFEAASSIFDRKFDSFEEVMQLLDSNAAAIAGAQHASKEDWFRLWSNVTSVGAPWYLAKANEKINWKRDPCICMNFCPCKLKRNRHFDDHIRASYARDMGSVQSAEKRYLDSKAKTEIDLNLNPFAVEEIKQTKKILSTCTALFASDCTVRKVSRVKECTFILFRDFIHINSERTKVIRLNDIRYVFYRRVNHLPTAIEIICADGRSFLIDFKDRINSAMKALTAELQNRYVTVQQTPNFMAFFEGTMYTELWRQGKITNFDYLMRLNIFSGRSFNDPCVYPIFPWIIKDYTSEELDLKDPSIYRDLSKPIGAIGEERLKDLQGRLKDMKEVQGVSYLYSSYVICPLSVFLYLLRLEPFTEQHVQLQGGRFDHAARIFSSVADAYRLVTTFLNDYRELIPEFYFMDEFLTNENNFDLGKVKGRDVSDVQLPPWAKRPIDFTYIMRKALESDYVSEHLNEWIDLIWGYKQRGPLAESSSNTFCPELYDDIWNEPDLTEERKLEISAAISHIGQIPPQLFKNPHPQRKVLKPVPTLPQTTVVKTCGARCACITEPRHGEIRLLIGSTEGGVEALQFELKPGAEVQRSERIPIGFVNQIVMATDPIYLLDDFTVKRGRNSKLKDDVSMIAAGGDNLIIIGNNSVSIEVRSPRGVFSVPFFGDPVTCAAVSADFRTLAVGTEGCRVVICSLSEGRKVRAYEVSAKPSLIAITESLGLIISFGIKSPGGVFEVHTINGENIGRCEVACDVACWCTFKSIDGLDYVVFADHVGRLFYFEVFNCKVGFSFHLFPRMSKEKPVVQIHASPRASMVVAVLRCGDVVLVPFDQDKCL